MLQVIIIWNVVFFTITTALLFYIDGKILHLDQCGKFDANLSIVMTNRKLVSFLIDTKSNVNLQTCITKCVLNKKCQSINFKDEGGNCELLSGNSKTDGAIVRTEDKWVHYETDPLNREIGEVCEEKTPCPLDFCEDVCEPPGFKCSCSSANYTGVQCDVYKEFNKFTSVNVSQTLVDTDYVVTIVIAGTEVKTETNSNPEEFEDVKLFVSDNWFKAGKRFIKNLIFENLDSCS